jgi:hypothetical protein
MRTLLRHWGLSAPSQSAPRLQPPRIGTGAIITAITTITVVAELGTAAGPAGPFRAAYVSPIRGLLVLGGAGIDRYGEAAHCGGLFFWPQIQVCNQFMYGENFSRTVELIMPARVEPRPLRDIL